MAYSMSTRHRRVRSLVRELESHELHAGAPPSPGGSSIPAIVTTAASPPSARNSAGHSGAAEARSSATMVRQVERSSSSSAIASSSSVPIGLTTPQLEQAEEQDEFLPLTSPFSPGYSLASPGSAGFVNGSNAFSNGRRRGSGSGPPPVSPMRVATNGDSSTSAQASPTTSMTAAERREHSRRHSRVHSRNLSVFFPRPEQKGLPGYQSQRSHLDEDEETEQHAIVSADVPGAATKGWGYANGDSSSSRRSSDESTGTQPSARRGHHHRHSMSHNFFPFIDGSTQSPRRASGHSTAPVTPQSGFHTPDTPKAVPSLAGSTRGHRHTRSDPSLIPSLSLGSKYSHLPAPARLLFAVAFHLPLLTKIALTAACAEIVLGAHLWIAGQTGESLAVTGLGYLVVFDGMAALSSVIVEGNARGIERLWDIMSGRRAGDNGVRFPFGTARITTLSHFAQCVYLIFSAVYVCKESIEHVLLLHGPDDAGGDHGASHGSFGHGESVNVGAGAAEHSMFEPEHGHDHVTIPTKLLLLSIGACLFAAMAMKNHAMLTDAVGAQAYNLRPRIGSSAKSSRLSKAINNALLSNPFTLIVFTFAVALAAASILIPAQQLAPLDKVVALLQSIAMFYVAYPAAVCTGRTLLQTAPQGFENTGPMANLRRALEEIENHSAVVYLPQPHIWQLNPHPPAVVVEPSLKSSTFGRKSLPVLKYSGVNKDPIITVVTLNVQVRPETSDNDILQITEWCREKCMQALTGHNVASQGSSGAFSTSKVGQPNRQAELTVQVVRFDEKRALQAEVEHQHQGHSHSHDQGHSHSHDQGGSHHHSAVHDAGSRDHAHHQHGGHEPCDHSKPTHDQDDRAHSHSHDHDARAHMHHH